MSTMLDTQFSDAHMSDYAIDIDMHQPAESWFDTEAKMEDDATLHNHCTDHESTLSVEVDMEDPYDEYEMNDGEGEENYEEMSSDLLDIEVYDASEPLEDATIPPAEHVQPPDSHPFDIDSPETTKPSMVQLPAATTPAMSPLPPLDAELPDALAPQPVEIVDEEPVDEENAAAEQPVDPPAESIIQLPVDENVETTQEHQNQESAEVQEQVEANKLEEPPSEEHSQSLDATAVSDSHDVEEPVVADPHEISEGVYIDPPPAVLVSLESSDVPDVCLFNQPVRSRSPSPSTEGHGQGLQVFDLLLHHRPILYYEPLASVFEALRQEEYLTRIPQLADSELVLDAYDLQLVISEDNVYAREVTLHDLNVLHDGSDISGPLRLRLKSVVPRFILRYHLLQDQVARLNLVAAADEQERPAEYNEQDQERPSVNKQNNDELQIADAQEEASESAAAPSTMSSNDDDPAAPQPLDTSTSLDQDARRETLKQEREVPVAETEMHPDNAPEESADAGENVETHEEGEGGGGDGEKSQYDEVDDAEAEGFPELPDDEEQEEEEFVVVETPGPKPIIPLTGPVTEDTGKEIEQASDAELTSSSGRHAELGPSNSQNQSPKTAPTANVDTEDPTSTLADYPADPSVHGDTLCQEENYDDEEETQWEDAVDGGDPDTTWEAEVEHESTSNESSVTLSSKASKRSFDEVDLEEEVGGTSPPGSPGAKRTRVD